MSVSAQKTQTTDSNFAFAKVLNRDGFDYHAVKHNGKIMDTLVRVKEGASNEDVANALFRGWLVDKNLRVL